METRNIDALLVRVVTSKEFRDQDPVEKDDILNKINSFRDRMSAVTDAITVKEIATYSEKASNDLKDVELDSATKIDLLTAAFKDLVNAALNKAKQSMKRHQERKASGQVRPKKTTTARAPRKETEPAQDEVLKSDLTHRYGIVLREYRVLHSKFNPVEVTEADQIPKDLALTLKFKVFLDQENGDKANAEKIMDSKLGRDTAAAALAKHFPFFKGVKSFFAHVSGSFRKSDWADKLAQD